MSEKIDIVYTWVNGKDKTWKDIRNQYDKDIGDKSAIRFNMNSNPSSEILLSINSVLKYAPWVNNIYIVTMRPQIPELGAEILSRVKIIHHDQIWKDISQLPVFNSHAIEANIHRIPGLCEKFIYLNDDMYFGDNVSPKDFYEDNKLVISKYFLSNSITKILKKIKINKVYSIYIKAHSNLSSIMKENYIHQKHFSVPLTKSLMIESEKYYGKIWDNTILNKFRNSNDIPPICATLCYAKSLNKINILKRDKQELYCNSNISLFKILFNNKRYKFICLNNLNLKDNTYLFDLLAKIILHEDIN